MELRPSSKLKLRFAVTLDVEASDYVEAAAHQKRVETCLMTLASEYPGVSVEMRERREGPRRPPNRGAVSTGRVSLYD